MINIYFTASTLSTKLAHNHKKVFSMLTKTKGILILSGAQIVNKKFLEKDTFITEKVIFERERKLIDSADAIIAEVTEPSTGVGGEIVYALTKGKPVLALIYEDKDDVLTPMLKGNPSENLYLEHYTENNIHIVLKNFLKHLKTLKKRKGKLIVIDGGDGAGKATQAKLLVDYYKKKKIPVKYVDFPRYYNSFHGKTVAKFLRGEFGGIDQVSPYLASLSYALDRASIKEEMEEFLAKGGIIIANRYATSNMAHQTAKFKTKKEQKEFLKWVYDLEYKIHKIPKENIVIYLYIPKHISSELVMKKGKRQYLNGKDKDIHERDDAHVAGAEQMYLNLSKKYKHWKTVDCTSKKGILPIQTIHKMILKNLTF